MSSGNKRAADTELKGNEKYQKNEIIPTPEVRLASVIEETEGCSCNATRLLLLENKDALRELFERIQKKF